MRIFSGTLLFPLAVFLNSIELSLSAEHILPRAFDAAINVHYYKDLNGALIPLIEGTRPPPIVDENERFLLGVEVEGHIRPIYDIRRRQVIVLLQTRQNIPMDRFLNHMYGHLYQLPD